MTTGKRTDTEEGPEVLGRQAQPETQPVPAQQPPQPETQPQQAQPPRKEGSVGGHWLPPLPAVWVSDDEPTPVFEKLGREWVGMPHQHEPPLALPPPPKKAIPRPPQKVSPKQDRQRRRHREEGDD